MSEVLDLCDRWDTLSKGESETTRAVREAYAKELSGPSAHRLDAVMAEIESLGYGTVEYHEAMWMLLSVMARRQAIIADNIRMNRQRRERAAETRAARKAEKAGAS